MSYKVIWRGGTYQYYRSAAELPVIDETVWAVINLDIIDGGDACEELIDTLDHGVSYDDTDLL